jgi:hypothetical protein
VPKVAIHEDDESGGRKHEVGSSDQSAVINAVPATEFMHGTAQS